MDQQISSPLGYPVAGNEEERLQEVLSHCFADGDMGATLDSICRLAQSLFDVPMVLVSIVGRDTQNFIAKCGLEADGTAREDSFCTYTILEDEVLIVPDATADPRFVNNRLVTGDMHLRFYAGAPLTVRPGTRIGSLCLLDSKPRSFSQADAEKLEMLATIVVNEIRRRRAIVDLRRQQHFLAQTARMTKIGSWSYDVAADALNLSDDAYRVFEIDPAINPSWKLLRGFWGGESGDAFEADLNKTIAKGIGFDRTFPIVTWYGHRRWVRCLVEAETEAGKTTIVIGSFQDVTEAHSHAAAIEWLAFRDPLTGLPNRAFFRARLVAAVREARGASRKLGLLLFDLDHFKDINDTLGHEAGDSLLVTLTERLEKLFCAGSLLFRLGGDEFALLAPNIADKNAMTCPAERLQTLLSTPQDQGHRSLSITASIGSAVYPDDDRDPEQLLRNAEIALQQAKSLGRNRHIAFEGHMRDDITARRALLAEVKVGLGAHEFELYYQPIIAIGQPYTVAGFEALMRWQHPARGLLTPEKFFAAFEDQEMSLAMGDTVLDSALGQMRAWLNAGVDFGRIAINVSAAQFRSGDLVAVIMEKLKCWQIPADRLILEVTEQVYIGWGAGVVGDTIRALHNAGALIALDDFGTGYASLQHLKQFPIDRLKIDRSFVRDLHDPAIVSAIVRLGQGMGIKVTAEGVEDHHQLDVLEALGCNLVQGYYFAKPMPSTQVAAYLANFDTQARRAS